MGASASSAQHQIVLSGSSVSAAAARDIATQQREAGDAIRDA